MSTPKDKKEVTLEDINKKLEDINATLLSFVFVTILLFAIVFVLLTSPN